MKKIATIILVFFTLSCSSNKSESALILPPDFETIPNLIQNTEVITK
jgi:hypothetical protein